MYPGQAANGLQRCEVASSSPSESKPKIQKSKKAKQEDEEVTPLGGKKRKGDDSDDNGSDDGSKPKRSKKSKGKKSDKKTRPDKRNSKKDQKDGKRRAKTKKCRLEGGNSSGETCFDGWSDESQSGDSSEKMDDVQRALLRAEVAESQAKRDSSCGQLVDLTDGQVSFALS